ncbi:serine hydrolase [Saccharopolyspora sp. 5N708]|uniref:serine hydrolase n=1 Tax=Saccharopolyspora sp. 5N708 TaxID=3457424 RepID=UPI003FD05C78
MTQQQNEWPRGRRSRRGTRWLATVTVLLAVLATVFVLVRRSDGSEPGAVVFDRVENETLHAENADRQFRSASLVKLLIGIDLVDRGAVTPARPSPRLTRMLATSDDEIANQLWISGGGQQIVTRVAAAVGLSDTEPPDDPGRWGDTLITADDMVKLYQHILAMPTAERALLLDPLRDAARTATDGTDQYFGIPDALSDQPWAIKQGWADGRGGVDAHTSGLVGGDDRYIVVVLTHHPEGFSLPTAQRRVTAEVAELAELLD